VVRERLVRRNVLRNVLRDVVRDAVELTSSASTPEEGWRRDSSLRCEVFHFATSTKETTTSRASGTRRSAMTWWVMKFA
jgi:hypothetical protein